MKLKLFTERGQALIIITLAAVGIFGIVGLAIDGGAKFADQRAAQNAADTAALAAKPQNSTSRFHVLFAPQLQGAKQMSQEAGNLAFEHIEQQHPKFLKRIPPLPIPMCM